MKSARPAASILLALVCASSNAQTPPATPTFSAVYDSTSRVQKVEYNDNLVISVVGYVDNPFSIELSPGEEIKDVAGGGIVSGKDLAKGTPGGWELNRSGSRMFVRPLADAKKTTVLVSTRTRVYLFDFIPASPSSKDYARRVSRVVMTYPAPVAPPSIASSVSPVGRSTEPPTPEDTPVVATLRNDNYSMEIVSQTIDIKPYEVYDDGRFTYFKFPGNLPIPTIYRSVPNTQEEWLVNTHRDGDYIVMHGVSRLWNLRLEGSVIGVFNDAFDAHGAPPLNGTTVPGLKRVAQK